MNPTLVARFHDTLCASFSLLAARYTEGTLRDGAGLLFALTPDDPDGELDVDWVRFITRRNWTEYVLATHTRAPVAEAVAAIEVVADVVAAALPPLSLPVVVVRERGTDVSATVMMLTRPAAASLPALRATN